MNLIIYLLNIIFQHCIFEGYFPDGWKNAAVIPLYKGKGNVNVPTSYRPINQCSCIVKVLEKVIDVQLKAFMVRHDIFHSSQHGFTAGRSTLTNLLTADAHATIIISLNHSYNYYIFTFDFKKAFDKTPYQYVLKALSELGIKGHALE